MPELDELTLTIARHLEADKQYIQRFPPWETERIAAVRSAGRKAGRHLGCRVITLQSNADGGTVAVAVVVRPDPETQTQDRRDSNVMVTLDMMSVLSRRRNS